jgi:hypothetical protein
MAKSVTDSAGDTFTELLHFTAADHTEESVWSAPAQAASSAPLTITVTPTSKADIGAAVLEYSGLSTAADATAADQSAHAVGKTGSGTAMVASGATQPTTADNELALGFYADSGFGDTVTPAAGYNQRINISNVGDMELLAEDQSVAAGAAPNASVTTGASTYWLMSTVVFKAASVSQTAQISQALSQSVSLARTTTTTPQSTGSSPRTAALRRGPSSRAASPRRIVKPVRCGRGQMTAATRRACASLRHAAAVAKRDRRHWIYEALVQHLNVQLLCHWNGGTLRDALGLSAGWYAAQ